LTPSARRYLDGRDIEIIAGDITGTCHRLEGDDAVLTFIDTENYIAAAAALEVVRERTVPGR
jgi:O-methyltransferase